VLFQAQQNSANMFMKEFDQLGIYYYSIDIPSDNRQKTKPVPKHPLAIIVLPEIRFHYQAINRNHFDIQPVLANVGDFVIWEFANIISHNVISLHPNATLQDLISCHERASVGRNRQCLGAECMLSGTFFFANPG
jgi:hypothetical protein